MEPRIEARWTWIHNGIGNLALVLRTRFGDNLILKDATDKGGFWHQNTQMMLDFVDAEMNNLTPYNNLEVVALPFETENFISTILHGPLDFNYSYDISSIAENNMRKYYDTENNILYLVNEGLEKFAFSIQDDYILDTYGIRNWVDSMQTIQISNDNLDNYTIVGL